MDQPISAKKVLDLQGKKAHFWATSVARVSNTMKPNERIRQARINAGLSQAELAERAGAYQPDISALERCWSGSPRFRQRVAEVLSVELSAAEVVTR